MCPAFNSVDWMGCFAVRMKGVVTAIALLGVGSRAFPLAARGTPSVDLGYAIYEGTQDSQHGINVFKG